MANNKEEIQNWYKDQFHTKRRMEQRENAATKEKRTTDRKIWVNITL